MARESRVVSSSCKGSVGLCRLAVLFVIGTMGAGAWADAVTVTVLENSPDHIVVDYQFEEFTQTAMVIDGQTYTRLSLGKESPLKVKGAPELPTINRSVAIGDAEMELHVVDAAYTEYAGVQVVPSRGFILRTVDPADVPYVFGDVYDVDAFYPGQLAALEQPYILRDMRGQVVQVCPFQYNPQARVLRVYTHVTVELVTTGPAVVNPLSPRPDRALSLAFHQLYKHHFINYVSPSRYDPLDEEGELLIICYDEWLPNIQPLVEHKNAIGIDTTAVGVSVAGSSSSAIKDYIEGVYDSSDLAFVLLVGDAAQVPTPYSSGGASDPTYAKLVGGDDYPEIMVGRFSAENAGQVDTQVERTVEYEDLQATQQEWFWKGVGIASSQGAGIGDEGQADYVHIGEIRDWLMDYGYTHVDEIYDPGASASQVSAALNDGRGIVNYCGHGSPTSWGTTGFGNNDVNNLVNDNMLPFITTVACNNGEFDSYTCFGEAWLRATHDGEPTGAIGCYASSISQSWAPPMEAQDEFNLLYTAEEYVHLGTLCYAGSCSMMDDYGSGGVSMFDTWILFGDPTLRVVGVAYMPPVKIELPDGAPGYLDPGEPTPILVHIEDGREAYVPGSGTLHYRYDGGDFVSVPLSELGDSYYEVVLPAGICTDTPEFYFSAQGAEGGMMYQPGTEDGFELYEATVATVTVLLDDDFEADRGWTVESIDLTDGEWERGIPVGDGQRGDPPNDCDGSGQCFLTDNAIGNSDVDGGPTRLISPVFDLRGMTDPVLEYARWWTNDDCDDDPFTVALTDDGGATWTVVEVITVVEDDASEWVAQAIHIADYVNLTQYVQVRFSAEDNPNNSVNEGGIDAVKLFDVACNMGGSGDLNCDGATNFFDIEAFVLAVTDPDGYAVAYPDCDILNGDCNGDGVVDFFDVDAFVVLVTE